MRTIPSDPFELGPDRPFVPAARRPLRLFGAAVELCWLPERRGRDGRPGPERPPFPRCAAPRILAEEALWSGHGLVLTPNLHPFATRQLLLWSATPVREPDETFLEVGFALAAAASGVLLVNSIGAAASIAWAHAHLIGEQQPFLPSLPREPLHLDALADLGGLELGRLGAPFPAACIALAGSIEVRARAAARLIRHRTWPAFGIVDQGGTTWLFPRRCEVPSPHFPQALGTAELWGRWCYDDERAFAAATPADLAAALALAG
jgi:hypothetical protein